MEITDFGQIGARYYLMMELLEGETLEERIEREKMLDEMTAIEVAVQVANALSAAHELGVVHRDLKPENIYLVTKPGNSDFVKVLDFGIAKLTFGAASPHGATVPARSSERRITCRPSNAAATHSSITEAMCTHSAWCSTAC